jgi:hypothetical protein
MTNLFLRELETERLLIRRFKKDDLEAIHGVYEDAGWVDERLKVSKALEVISAAVW